MSEREHSVKIIASTSEGFEEIKKLLDLLPDEIYDQIETAEQRLAGLECNIRSEFKDEHTVNLPNNISSLRDYSNYVGINCGEYFFKVSNEGPDVKEHRRLHYNFIDISPSPKT